MGARGEPLVGSLHLHGVVMSLELQDLGRWVGGGGWGGARELDMYVCEGLVDGINNASSHMTHTLRGGGGGGGGGEVATLYYLHLRILGVQVSMLYWTGCPAPQVNRFWFTAWNRFHSSLPSQ